jgi:DUF917 family protein
VIHVGLAGAPDIVMERLPSGDEWGAAIRALEHHLGREADALGVIEIGGLNALLPLVAGAALGLPVVDGDLMGRAFPRLPQTVLAIAGIGAGPIALVGPSGETVVFDCPDDVAIERVMRALINSVGGAAAVACYPIAAGELARHGIAGSVTRAHELGAALAAGEPPGELLFAGRVAEIERSPTHLRSVVLEDPERLSHVARIDIGDEYLAVAVDGVPAALVPDIIVLLDRDERRPVAVGALRAGRHVLVIRLAAPEALHAHQDVFGPPAFGLVT